VRQYNYSNFLSLDIFLFHIKTVRRKETAILVIIYLKFESYN